MTTRDLDESVTFDEPAALAPAGPLDRIDVPDPLDAGHHLQDPTRRQLAVVALSSAGLVAALMQTLVMPLIPRLPELVHANESDASWVITGTLLSAAVFTPVSGRLGDMFGKRRILLLTLGLLVIGSAVSGMADSLGPMVVGRVLQGTAMGCIPLGISLMRDILPENHRASAIAFLSSTLGMGGAIGLPVAAVIADRYSWHVLFWGAGGLGLISAAAIAMVVPESPVRSPGRFDYLGTAGLVVGLVSVLLAISKGNTWGWGSTRVLGLIATAAIVFPLWGRYQLRRRGPLVDLRISSRRPVLLTNIASVMVGFAMYGSVMIMPQLLQAPKGTGFGLGLSMVGAGFCMTPSGLVMLVASPLSARLTAARGARVTLMAGTAILTLAYLISPLLMSAAWELVVVSTIIGCGMALGYSAMPTLIMNSVPENETAAANGLNALMRSLGTSLSSALMAVILAGALATATAGHATAHQAASGRTAFRLAFLVAAAGALIGTLLTFALPRAGRPAPSELAESSELAA